MRSHTVGFITMITVGAYVQYRKQKLNTKSSTKSDRVGVGNVLTQEICTQYFLKYQGYDIHDNILYQDNQSAIKSENNGRQSIIKRISHINIRYYFITDSITNQETSAEFFPTLYMMDNYSTKALQGYKFHRFVISSLVSMNITFPPIMHQ